MSEQLYWPGCEDVRLPDDPTTPEHEAMQAEAHTAPLVYARAAEAAAALAKDRQQGQQENGKQSAWDMLMAQRPVDILRAARSVLVACVVAALMMVKDHTIHYIC